MYVYICFSSGVAWHIASMVHTHFSMHFASFSISLNIVWQPDSLINMDGSTNLLKDHEARSGSLDSYYI